MVIDGGNPGDSSLMYGYLNRLGISQLDYMVMIHPHEDHGGGLPGALNYATVTKAAFASMQSDPNKVFENYATYLSGQHRLKKRNKQRNCRKTISGRANDDLAAYCRTAPDHLYGCAALPIADVDAAEKS